MPGPCYRFGDFSLDTDERRLLRGGAPVDVSGRYFDALALMVREPGRLVSKARFFNEVWRGVPVTDEALSQCVRTLRRQLGDSAALPRFIETVPKHGYRFIAPVDEVGRESTPGDGRKAALRLVGAGTLGGGLAGAGGGFLYALGGAYSADSGMGSASVLLVLLIVCVLVGLLGGFGVSAGMFAPSLVAGQTGAPRPSVVGAALGGFAIGGAARLVGLDALNLLFGSAPADITGAMEGAILGGAIALGALIGRRAGAPWWRPVIPAGIAGGIAGAVIARAGGRLMGGSLDGLSDAFATSRLKLDSMGALFGESEFGPLTQSVMSGIEGAAFAIGVIGAIALASRHLPDPGEERAKAAEAAVEAQG